MTKPAVAVYGLTKIFPGALGRAPVTALRDLNLEVATGSVYGLLGPNGSGKSTTLKIVLGLISPTHGSTEIFGTDSQEIGARAAIGFLPESPYFHKFLTGAETLRFYGRLCGLGRRKLRDRISELLELVGLTSARHRRLATYSKGMLQRIGLAQALVDEPRLLVLDEPTAGVDPAGSRDICDLILGLKQRGMTVLLSSHLLGQVQEICDRVGILARGSLVCEGPLVELIALEHQTEVILENASPALLGEIERAALRSGARLLSSNPSRTSLERRFLEAINSR
jgi:ABC-2 type transport system ATP-binding protein